MTNTGRGCVLGSNVMFVRNDTASDSGIAMVASCSPAAFQVKHGAVGLEDTSVSCGKNRSHYPTFDASGEDLGEEDHGDDCSQPSKKRRLTFDQVRFLEKNFDIENKLEPERKLLLAKELGLRPRQVAVWFQNRRARWRTKQLERDYESLTSGYKQLKSEFEAMLQEKQDLQGEVERLTEKLQTVQPGPADPSLEKSKKHISMSHPSPQWACEGSVKSERIPEIEANNDGLSPCKEEGSKETFSDSFSSELFNSDSPCTMNSGSLLPVPDDTNMCSLVSTELVGSSIVHMTDGLYEQMLSPKACQRISVKSEHDSCQNNSCNYILAQLDLIEEKGLPWWDWP
uniref:Homeobox domain-containing protein n=1 Tax=Physcomitrium patens TaxID=3218 RepID=A0A2K1J9I9_PHYPA|nr:hypothetical protein PHYPA_021306 [Physcomitrium patens]